MAVASSTATLGLGYDRAPDYLPVEENHPLLTDGTYGLSKEVIETMIRLLGGTLTEKLTETDYCVFDAKRIDKSLAKINDDGKRKLVNKEFILDCFFYNERYMGNKYKVKCM